MLAHGAGAGQHSPFMTAFAAAIAARGIDVVTFNFLYTEQKRRLPDRGPALEACYLAAIDATRREVASARRALFIGGKSMGGRIATQVAAADADVCRSPAWSCSDIRCIRRDRPDKRRDAHLPDVKRPMLFVQGSRDTFGTPDELSPILEPLSPRPDGPCGSRRRPFIQSVAGGARRTGGGLRAGPADDRVVDPRRGRLIAD